MDNAEASSDPSILEGDCCGVEVFGLSSFLTSSESEVEFQESKLNATPSDEIPSFGNFLLGIFLGLQILQKNLHWLLELEILQFEDFCLTG